MNGSITRAFQSYFRCVDSIQATTLSSMKSIDERWPTTR